MLIFPEIIPNPMYSPVSKNLNLNGLSSNFLPLASKFETSKYLQNLLAYILVLFYLIHHSRDRRDGGKDIYNCK
jgi:hypothetical protein